MYLSQSFLKAMGLTLCNRLPSLVINYKVLQQATKFTSLEILTCLIELIDYQIV